MSSDDGCTLLTPPVPRISPPSNSASMHQAVAIISVVQQYCTPEIAHLQGPLRPEHGSRRRRTKRGLAAWLMAERFLSSRAAVRRDTNRGTVRRSAPLCAKLISINWVSSVWSPLTVWVRAVDQVLAVL